MRLRFQHDNVEDGQGCGTILSLEPQFRTIYTMGNGYSTRSRYDGNIVTLPWPHLIFVFRYTKVEGGYMYGGLYGNGLRVLLKSEPLRSFDDLVAYAPTEHHGGGLACTDHGWDNSLFKNPQELMGTILEIWWGSAHHMRPPLDISAWKKMSVEEVVTYKWGEVAKLSTLLPFSGELIDKDVGILPSVLKKGPKLYGRR